MQQDGADQTGREVDWAMVRALYEAGEVPVSRICDEFGITEGKLRWRRETERWKVRAQVGRPTGPAPARAPAEIAAGVVARVLAAQANRLIAAPRPVAERDMLALAALAKAVEGWMREDRLSRQRAPAEAEGKSTAKAAVGGGPNAQEEARAADVAWMRAELKRRLDVLARSRQGGEGSPDRQGDRRGD